MSESDICMYKKNVHAYIIQNNVYYETQTIMQRKISKVRISNSSVSNKMKKIIKYISLCQKS